MLITVLAMSYINKENVLKRKEFCLLRIFNISQYQIPGIHGYKYWACMVVYACVIHFYVVKCMIISILNMSYIDKENVLKMCFVCLLNNYILIKTMSFDLELILVRQRDSRVIYH